VRAEMPLCTPTAAFLHNDHRNATAGKGNMVKVKAMEASKEESHGQKNK
jgi:hypothetical protein